MTDPVFDIFCEEAKEHLGALEKGFLDLETAALPEARRGQIDNLFRHAHSLKGDARAIGLAALQEAAQRLEDILDALRNTPEKVNREVINQGLGQLDIIRRAFEAWQRTLGEQKAPAESPTSPSSLLADEATGQPGDKKAPAATGREQSPPVATPSLPDESFTVRVPSERLDRMLNLAGELRIVQRLGEELSQRLVDLNEFLGGVLERFQQLEHSIADSRLSIADCKLQIANEIANLHPLLEGCRDQVGRVANSLRKKRNREDILLEALEADIQQARLLPLVMLTDSLRRAVRDLGQSLDKSIRYEVDVGNVLLDKAILEALRDPMLHLLRNAASHGIEPPRERGAAGKSAEGVIRIQAAPG